MHEMSRLMGKPTMWFPNKHRGWLEAGNFEFRKKGNCTIHVTKTKVLISFAVTAKQLRS